MAKRGRKTKLTPELQERICKFIEQGFTIEQSCALAGINVATYYNWKKWGRQARSGKFFEFFKAAETSEKVAEAKFLSTILKAAVGDDEKGIKSDWRAAAWYLERKNPEQWAKTEKLEQEIKADVKAKLSLSERIKQAEKYFKELEGDGGD